MHKKTWGGDLERIMVQDTNQCCCCAQPPPPEPPPPSSPLTISDSVSASHSLVTGAQWRADERARRKERELTKQRGGEKEVLDRLHWDSAIQPAAKCYRQAHKTGLLCGKMLNKSASGAS